MITDFVGCTKSFEQANAFLPQPPCVYLHGDSPDERSKHFSVWQHKLPGVLWIKVQNETRDGFTALVDGATINVPLRSSKKFGELLRSSERLPLYIDITGLRHGTWAGILRSLYGQQRSVNVVYVEPDSYKSNLHPTENDFFDLSTGFEGVSQLRGFAGLTRTDSGGIFIPLLGFEGTRLAFIINSEEPLDQMIYPVIGVPGFRPEYPYTTMWTNRKVLLGKGAWKRVSFAPADCPFAAYRTISELHERFRSEVVRLAPIGTKPHALGAVLYAIRHPRETEIVYDHPTQVTGGRRGITRLHVYDVSQLLRT